MTCKNFFEMSILIEGKRKKKKLICENTLFELLTYFNIKISRFASFHLYVYLHALLHVYILFTCFNKKNK